MSEHICPVCGNPLKEVYDWNPEIFGTENNTKSWICTNKDCHGWFCPACEEWHPYGTDCSVYWIHRVRGKL